MLFCEKCGGILVPQKEGKCKELVCSKCNFKQSSANNASLKEEIRGAKLIPVVEKDIRTLPTVDAECPKCKNHEALFWMQQMRAGDEAETQFFECTKCKYRWRKSD